MKSVELHDAFFFSCEECGKDNFVRSISISPEELEDTEDQAILDEMTTAMREIAENFKEEGLILEQGQKLMLCPRFVTCQFCAEKFQTFEDDDE
jgi:hypothetical protein